MSRCLWRFSHANEKSQIVIHDEQSAIELMRLLAQLGQSDWKMAVEKAPAAPGLRVVPAAQVAAAQQAAASAPVALAAPAPAPLPTLAAPAAPPAPTLIMQKPAAPSERRQHPRHKGRFRVLLVAGARIFRTHTSDVSLGGIALERAVPAHFRNAPQCLVIIGHRARPENLEFRCQLLGEAGEAKRVRFANIEPASSRALESWLGETARKAAA
jgi:hypothetical protein